MHKNFDIYSTNKAIESLVRENMSYYAFEYLTHASDLSTDKFYVEEFTYPNDCNLDLSLIFDLPSDIQVRIDSVDFPGDTFDYFNPLILSSEIHQSIKFHSGTEIVKNFICSRIILPVRIETLLGRLLKQKEGVTFAYSPEIGIKYPHMSIVHKDTKHRQICDFLRGRRPYASGISNLLNDNANLLLQNIGHAMFGVRPPTGSDDINQLITNLFNTQLPRDGQEF